MIGRFTTNHVSTVAIAALPTSRSRPVRRPRSTIGTNSSSGYSLAATPDRKSTRLNSSHANISYAVFCLKKKETDKDIRISRKLDIDYIEHPHLLVGIVT